MTADVTLESQRVRRDIRAGRITGTSRGLAHSFVQCNLAILPREYAFDFLLYCQRNQRACPVLEVTDPGDPVTRKLAPGADLRTDCARYTIFVDGIAREDRADIRDLWRDDLVAFLIGSGITFDGALERAGVPTDRYRWVLRTKRPTEPAGPFRGDLIVTMRWLTPEQAITATQVSARFPFNHGAPIHIGDPAAIGADLAAPMFGGPVPAIPDGLIAVFWACGVTPQSAAEAAGLPLFITHAAAHSFVTDLSADRLMLP
ncbi:MAG: DUF1445 domain-containing protein [Rhizobiales bacterium]|nr:DUF1445 domain-containing protein [Hyphomicrobiales bacterium]